MEIDPGLRDEEIVEVYSSCCFKVLESLGAIG
jgi:hypothetical protein